MAEERINLPEWQNIPTIKEATGANISYQMLRGIFMAPGVPADALAWYADVFKKAMETPEWKKYTTDNALNVSLATGADFTKWLETKEALTKDLMQKGSLIK
jgi:tripartite-type tricarboxylate transporter receptor subunit TctC